MSETPPCGELGPPPFPGAMRYKCTRDRGHQGAHEAHGMDDRLLDSWPQDREVSR